MEAGYGGINGARGRVGVDEAMKVAKMAEKLIAQRKSGKFELLLISIILFEIFKRSFILGDTYTRPSGQ